MYVAENCEFKFSRVESHLKQAPLLHLWKKVTKLSYLACEEKH